MTDDTKYLLGHTAQAALFETVLHLAHDELTNGGSHDNTALDVGTRRPPLVQTLDFL
jgi:hypothetical protein